jgi:negative regulator of sigma E activity
MAREPSQRDFWNEDFTWEESSRPAAGAPADEPARQRPRQPVPRAAVPAPGATRHHWDAARLRDSGREWTRERAWAVPVIVAAAVLLVAVVAVLAFDVGRSGSSRSATAPTTQATSSGTTAGGTSPSTKRARAAAALAAIKPTPALHEGVSGRRVAALQRALAAAGIPGVPQDGTYGPSTARAVRTFQRRHGLTADGVAGPATIARLLSALRGQS